MYSTISPFARGTYRKHPFCFCWYTTLFNPIFTVLNSPLPGLFGHVKTEEKEVYMRMLGIIGMPVQTGSGKTAWLSQSTEIQLCRKVEFCVELVI